jgi:hypothetical protein
MFGRDGTAVRLASAEDTYDGPEREVKITSASLGGERFIAQQLKPGSWSVLDRRHRELVGSDDKSHERAERRAGGPP